MKKVLLLVVVLAVALTGCVSNKAFQDQQERLGQLEQAFAQSTSDLSSLKRETSLDKKQLEETAQDKDNIDRQMRQNEADMRSLVRENAELARTLDEVSRGVIESDRAIVDMIKTLEKRVNALAAGINTSTEDGQPSPAFEAFEDQSRAMDAMNKQIKDLQKEVNQLKEAIANLPKDTPAASAPSTPAPVASASEESEYEAARDLYFAQKYKSAIQKLDEFLKKYPNSEYAGHAVYWKGESYYVQADMNSAIKEFRKVVSQYPKSSKAADAQLKIGMSYMYLGDKDNARTELNKVKTNYPNYGRMDLVEKNLNQLK